MILTLVVVLQVGVVIPLVQVVAILQARVALLTVAVGEALVGVVPVVAGKKWTRNILNFSKKKSN